MRASAGVFQPRSVGAGLIADSLTELVLPGWAERGLRWRADDEPPAVAHVNGPRASPINSPVDQGEVSSRSSVKLHHRSRRAAT
ncbi:hypothetical protein [Streptomyces sp. NPDC000994]